MTDTAAHWTPVDSRQHLAATDLELLTRLTQARHELDLLALALPAVFHLIRDHQAGGPRAATLDTSSGPAPWCWDHEQTTTECHAQDLYCNGEILTGPSDPTGNAATTPDRAARDLRELRRVLEATTLGIARAHAIAAGYPTHPAELPDVEPTPGEEWCRCCWKHAKTCQPITLRANGQPYYRGLCQWCGRWSKTLGAEPPTWMVAMRHRGEVITPAHAARAQAAVKAQAKKKPKGKTRKGRAA